MTAIDYQKYETMDKTTLLNALLQEEEKQKQLCKQVSLQNELISYLTSQVRDRLEQGGSSLDMAIEQMKNGEVESFKNFDEYKKAMQKSDA